MVKPGHFMLVLLFYLGEVMYAIKCDRVREIAPIVKLEQVPHAPFYLAGLFNYRGTIVPVIDLRLLIQGHPCKIRLSTRIILVDYLRDDGTPYTLGLMAERVTDAIRKPDSAFLSAGLSMEGASYLGSIVMEDRQMIQHIDLDLLPESFGSLPMLKSGENVSDAD